MMPDGEGALARVRLLDDVGDGEGVVVIPAHLAIEVARDAVDQEERETFILEKIRAGASIVGHYPPDEQTLAEFEEWKKNKAGK